MEVAEQGKMYQLEGKYWWWVGRRILINNMLKRLNLNSALILDAGCGTGINRKHLECYGKVIGLDLSREALDFCKMRGFKNTVQGNAECLPFHDNAFDLITALDLLEHLDDKKALTNFYRVLRPNGFLLINVPAFNFMWSKHDEALHHKRRYRKNQLRNVLELNGFTIEKIYYWNFFLFLPILAIRLIKKRNNQAIKTDVGELSGMINSLLASILRIESHLIPHVNIPFGVSILCLCKKIVR